MKSNALSIVGILLVAVSIGILTLAVFIDSVILLLIGVLSIVVSTILYIFSSVYETFKHDKYPDFEQLIKSGLTITNCIECGSENVLEDQYCIHCGEKLYEFPVE